MTPVPTPSDADGVLGEEDGLRLLGACYEGSHAVFGVVADLLARAREQGRAEGWDEGWEALVAEELRQRLDPTHPISRHNPHHLARDTQGGSDG